MEVKYRVLLSPFFLFPLFILILNDHFLKFNYPGFLAGKLSDFSGLIVLPIFISIIFRKYINSELKLLILHICIGGLFIIWKLAPIELLINELQQFTPVPLPSRVKDPTDLTAIAVLPVSFLFMRKNLTEHKVKFVPVFKRTIVICLLLVSGLAIMATTMINRIKINPEETYTKNISNSDFLFLVEETLTEAEFVITKQYVNDLGEYQYDIYIPKKECGDGELNVKFLTDKTWTYEMNFICYNYNNPEIKDFIKKEFEDKLKKKIQSTDR